MKQRLSILLFLVSALTGSCALFAKEFECPLFFGVVEDEYTGKPIEGAVVNLSWSALRQKGYPSESSDWMTLHTVSVVTDKNGIYKIPAWKKKTSAGWIPYEWDPSISISKQGTSSFQPTNSESQQSLHSSGLAIKTVKLDVPAWAISEEEVSNREQGIVFPNVSAETLSNSLTFFSIHDNMVENGRHVGPGYIRPKPELVITRIQSFSINVPSDYFTGHAIAIVLLPVDAKKVENLCLRKPPAVMLENKIFVPALWDDLDHATGHLIFPQDQDIREIEQTLQKLVRHK